MHNAGELVEFSRCFACGAVVFSTAFWQQKRGRIRPRNFCLAMVHLFSSLESWVRTTRLLFSERFNPFAASGFFSYFQAWKSGVTFFLHSFHLLPLFISWIGCVQHFRGKISPVACWSFVGIKDFVAYCYDGGIHFIRYLVWKDSEELLLFPRNDCFGSAHLKASSWCSQSKQFAD